MTGRPRDAPDGPALPAPWALALLLVTVVRLVVAAAVPLSPDEAYYRVWSRVLQPGYLDHPPMVALWIRLGTALAGDGALGVRLLAPLSAALGTVLLARAAEDMFPGRGAGPRAAVLLNATLLLGAGAVTMTPDTPLLLFWTAALWAAARLLRTGRGAWWLAVGALSGAAMASKYTAFLLPAGFGAWLLVAPGPRACLRRPQPWLGAALGALLFLPVVAWNAGEGWAGFARQGGRAGDWNPAGALRHLGELLSGQLGLATPLVAVLLAAGIVAAARGAWRRDPAWTLLAALTLPGVLVFLQHAVGDRVQANWPAVLYPAAAIGAGALGGRLWRPAAALGAAVTAVVYLQAAAAPVALPRALDFTLIRLGGWNGLAADVDRARRDAGAAFVASDEYGIASELAFRLRGVPVLGVEGRWRFFALPPAAAFAGRAGLLVRSARREGPPDPGPWASLVETGRLVRARHGVTAEEYRLYRATLRPDAGEAVVLPGRGEDRDGAANRR